MISVNDCIEIKAKEKIVLQAGQSAVTLEGGNITFACPGKFSVKGGKHLFDKGGKQPGISSKLPDTRLKLFDEAFIVKDANGLPVANLRYTIRRADGSCEDGMTNENGQTHLVSGTDAETLEIYVWKGDL